ncbi:hypothetical protein EIP86_011500 [Pleurotus ostreatoroseus]|nr:hypothetical protein EIP86_011500 [Pleurotus ostreatoroseus]
MSLLSPGLSQRRGVPEDRFQAQGGPYAPPPGPPPNWSGPYEAPFSTLPQVHSYSRNNTVHRDPRGSSSSAVKIASREEEFKRLFKACEAGKGNARLLREAIVYAKPQDLKNNDLVEEFRGKCRKSQELISSTVPWATAELEHAQGSSTSRTAGSEEERLLAQLLAANQELLDALQMYDDLLRAGTEQEDRARQHAERKLRALDAITAFQPTPAESALVDQLFAAGDPANDGTLSAHAAHALLAGAHLPPDVRARVWEIANVEESARCGRHCVGVALRLVGHAQQGRTVEEGLVNTPGPLASLDGFDAARRDASAAYNGAPSSSYTPPKPQAQAQAQSGPSSLSLSPSLSSSSTSPTILPPLTAADRAKFVNIFYNSGPENGVLSAQRARDVLLRSKLPLSTLGQIWELSDTQQRGALDAPAFCVAMYLVQGCMSGAIAAIPPTLPPFLYAEAAQAAPGFVPAPSPSPASAPVPIPVQQSSSTSGTGMPVPGTQPWTVSPEVRASADAFFEVLDERGAGFLDGEAARSHFMQSGLPQDAAAQVWRLADVDADGRLSRDEFAVALYLIQSRESGQELPPVLPASLVPPAFRRAGSRSQTPAFPTPQRPDEELLIDFEGPEEPVRMPIPMISTRAPPRTGTSPPVSPSTPASASFSTNTRASASPNISINIPPPLPSRTPSSAPRAPSAAPPLPPRTQSQSGSPVLPPVTTTEWTWALSAADRASAERFFDQLDPWKQGSVEGEAAVAFLSRSKLPPGVLAQIWCVPDPILELCELVLMLWTGRDLADRDGDGRLDKGEFAVVMFLVRGRLAGQALPESVPPALFEPVYEDTSTGPASAQQSATASPETMASVPAIVEQTRPDSDEPPPPYQENIPPETS